VVGVTNRDGSPAILKLSVPHEDARAEATALRCWDGHGAVRLLRCTADGFTLLLERCRPGHDMWCLSVGEQIEVVTELLPRLWLPSIGDAAVRELAETVAGWESRMRDEPHSFDAPAEVVARACRWARELSEDQPRRLLHGDLNPGNVLAAERDTWVAIDPKPWLGDPAFDLAQLLVNWARVDGRSGDEAASTTVRRAEQLAASLSLDVGRVLRWAVVKAVGWNAGRDDTLVLDTAARMQAS
jgi:streptomycin 6-kinase